MDKESRLVLNTLRALSTLQAAHISDVILVEQCGGVARHLELLTAPVADQFWKMLCHEQHYDLHVFPISKGDDYVQVHAKKVRSDLVYAVETQRLLQEDRDTLTTTLKAINRTCALMLDPPESYAPAPLLLEDKRERLTLTTYLGRPRLSLV